MAPLQCRYPSPVHSTIMRSTTDRVLSRMLGFAHQIGGNYAECARRRPRRALASTRAPRASSAACSSAAHHQPQPQPTSTVGRCVSARGVPSASIARGASEPALYRRDAQTQRREGAEAGALGSRAETQRQHAATRTTTPSVAKAGLSGAAVDLVLEPPDLALAQRVLLRRVHRRVVNHGLGVP